MAHKSVTLFTNHNRSGSQKSQKEKQKKVRRRKKESNFLFSSLLSVPLMATSCYSSAKFLLYSAPQRGANGRTARFQKVPSIVAMASSVDSSENSSGFAKRIERAWLISQVLQFQFFPFVFTT